MIQEQQLALAKLMKDLRGLGFGDPGADINGASTVDVINTHLPALTKLAPANPKITIKLLKKMPLVQALWWFIENTNEDTFGRSEIFFYLRDRMREGV